MNEPQILRLLFPNQESLETLTSVISDKITIYLELHTKYYDVYSVNYTDEEDLKNQHNELEAIENKMVFELGFMRSELTNFLYTVTSKYHKFLETPLDTTRLWGSDQTLLLYDKIVFKEDDKKACSVKGTTYKACEGFKVNDNFWPYVWAIEI